MIVTEITLALLEVDVCHPFHIYLFMCSLWVGREVAKTLPVSRCTLQRQVVGSALLGIHKKENMADSHHHIQRHGMAD